MSRQSTVAEINAEAARFQTVVGSDFSVKPNGYGVHVTCLTCRESASGDRGYRFPYEHKHTSPVHFVSADVRGVEHGGCIFETYSGERSTDYLGRILPGFADIEDAHRVCAQLNAGEHV